jgi:hypothetical protein
MNSVGYRLDVLPQVLYRGESFSTARPDPLRVREVRLFHVAGQGLFTKLANGGNPYELLTLGLDQAIRSHVTGRFDFTHFLSFSASEECALVFANNLLSEQEIEGAVDRGWSGAELWPDTKFALFSLDVKAREPTAGLPGCFSLAYDGGHHHALLIDAAEYLGNRNSSDLQTTGALENAKRYQEWLVLPTDPLSDGSLSALLVRSEEFTVRQFVDHDSIF